LLNNLLFRANLGYQRLPVKEQLLLPIEASNPAQNPLGAMASAHSQFEGLIAEPQLVYDYKGDNLTGGALLGTTFQEERNMWNTFLGTGYTNDAVLGHPYEAAETVEDWYASTYRYHGVYGRCHTDWRKRYFFNATGRLDASSRFGGQRKMAFFGALGAAWIFSEEKWMSACQWLRFGKLRASYGTAGNDNIDDYSYLETWITRPYLLPYDGIAALNPNRQANPLLGWEKNHKLEIALELEIANGLRFNAAWYRNITSDQLITANLPDQAGPIGNHTINWPAKVLNTGWEFSLQATHKWHRKNSYTSALVLTLPRNRLLAFPGLAASAYNNSLVIGQSLSVQRGYQFKGVDAITGLFVVPDMPNTVIAGNTDPQAYGGWSQECRLGRFRISLFLEARLQMALSSLYYSYASVAPGRWSRSQLTNQPRAVLQRWQQPGDQALLQRFTAASTIDVLQAIQYFRQSNIMLTNASFLRMRSLFLSWDLPHSWFRGGKGFEGHVFLQAQNLFTATPYRDGDPTLQYPLQLPSLRTIMAGLEINL
jgi:hypothetical protein